MPDDKDQQALAHEVELVRMMLADPDIGPKQRALIEQFSPGAHARAGAASITRQLEADRVALQKDRAEWKTEQELERQQRALQAARAALLADPTLRITAAELPQVEKLMLDETLGTHRAAAELYRARQRIATPRVDVSRMAVPGVAGAGGKEFEWLEKAVGKSNATLDQVARDRAYEALNELARSRE